MSRLGAFRRLLAAILIRLGIAFWILFAFPVMAVEENRPSDRQIATAVERLIETDSRLREAEVTVSSRVGTVTLKGNVSSNLQKHNAERVVKTVPGVKRVINWLRVESLPRRDEDIAFDVRRRLDQSNFVKTRELEVSVARGEVTIKGQVDTWARSRHAEWTAREVRGVTQLRNELVIGTDQRRADMDLQTSVAGTLLRDTFLAGLPIKVAVRDAEAVLRGRVLNLYQMDRATQEALSVRGIQRVANYLEIVPLDDLDPPMKIQSVQDDQLGKAVYRELENNWGADSAMVNVSASSGVVTLRGKVPSIYLRQRAERNTRSVVGVRRVQNQLIVNAEPRPDAEILNDVQFGLTSDAGLGMQRLAVQVQQGVVTLSGEVQDVVSKLRASRIAGRVRGVRSINDEIEVAWSRRFSDEDLTKRIEERLAANGQTLATIQQIQIRVEEGRVILTGQVDHPGQRREAERIAIFTDGIRSVDNRLTLRQRR